MRQELLRQNLNKVAGIVELDRTHRISLTNLFGPVTIRTEGLINIRGGVDELNADVLPFHIALDKSLDGESFAFEESFVQGSGLLVVD